jgi:thioesterase-3
MQSISITRVDQKHVDELGHLNHVFALQILEYARDDWYAEAGLWDGRQWTGSETLATIVLNVNFNYRLECFLDETVEVITSAHSRGNKSFILGQQIIKPDGQIAIEGTVISVIMDMDSRKTIPLPKSLARNLPVRS